MRDATAGRACAQRATPTGAPGNRLQSRAANGTQFRQPHESKDAHAAPDMNATNPTTPASGGHSLLDATALIASAQAVIDTEARAIQALRGRIGADFLRACQLMFECNGRVVVSGMGKSGHVARKIAATMASTGTPAFFVHPAEASHGDLGMVTRDDVFVALSNSGSTDELLTIVPVVKRQGARLIAITGDPGSPLARLADVHLHAAVDREACPLNLAPTASTTATLALGDALAVALLDARGFGPMDFALSHPGGTLGRRLLTRVADVMRSGATLPSVRAGARLVDGQGRRSRAAGSPARAGRARWDGTA